MTSHIYKIDSTDINKECWAVLLEKTQLNFDELNTLNYHSDAWSLSQGKPLLYKKLDQMIKYGFKNFIIGLSHTDQVLKDQISQLEALYQDCNFKCLQINDSWFFEKNRVISKEGERYLQHYLHLYLQQSNQPYRATCVWIQTISVKEFNPFQYLDLSIETKCPLFWLKHKNSDNKLSYLGVWLNLQKLAMHYKDIQQAKLRPCSGSLTRYCVESIEHVYQEVKLNDDIPSTQEDYLVASRSFNKVIIDTQAGVVIKSSSEKDKLNQEINFYNQLPKRLKIHFPRLLDTGDNQNTSIGYRWYSIEYYPYKSLSQFFVYYTLPLANWQTLFNKLMDIHKQFLEPTDNFSQLIDSRHLHQFYSSKLDSRIDAARVDKKLKTLIDMETVILNGKVLKGFKSLKLWLDDKLLDITQGIKSGFLHGDLCFSNILFEPSSGIVRLIDPRGEFMGCVNRGDPRYDLAKIMHSVHGRYDFIINDLFKIEIDTQGYHFSLPKSKYLDQVTALFLQNIEQKTNYKIDDLMLLESLLFLTMLPLHSDYPDRQIAFFLTGLRLLNEVYVADHTSHSANMMLSQYDINDDLQIQSNILQ